MLFLVVRHTAENLLGYASQVSALGGFYAVGIAEVKYRIRANKAVGYIVHLTQIDELAAMLPLN